MGDNSVQRSPGFSEDWRLSCSSTKQQLTTAMAEGHLTDVEFLVGREPPVPIRAHKSILAIFSPVFEAMFFGPLKEIQKQIPIPDLEPEGFRLFLGYIYSGELHFSAPIEAFYTFECAAKYLSDLAMDECMNFIANIPPTTLNVWTVMEISDTMDFPSVVWPKCLDLIAKHARKAMRTQDFLTARVETLLAVLQLDYMNADEIDLLNATVRWAEHNKEEGQSLHEAILPLLQLVRFGNISVEHFITFSSQNPEAMPEEDAAAITQYLLYLCDRFTLPAFCCDPLTRNRNISKDVKAGTDVSLLWSDKQMVSGRATFFSYLRCKDTVAGDFTVDYLELCWKFCGMMPDAFDVVVSFSPWIHRLPMKFRIETCFVNDSGMLRRWLPIHEAFSGTFQRFGIRLHLEFFQVTRMQRLAMSTFSIQGLKFEVLDFPCVSDMIWNGLSSELKAAENLEDFAKLHDASVTRFPYPFILERKSRNFSI